ncbi:RNA polymerase sigma factor [Pseudochryseolinea flava]|uniref:RNA polymerase subunit sigma-70 n=1 Tax=Pseudochryseolinea flava TaxID=2059302 RepID=A0A364Y580_9BACT|nr:RNA polymerase sigma factor [Pseudochryseolinea flava]RAW00977.1 RNA polymerase subunit sigma-70 [Pseudochryseolinea flava]
MHLLIEGCKKHDRENQRLLYQHHYAYAMSICLRYSRTREEAREILNDGFMKVFSKIDQYNPETSFQGWLRRIMINTAIDHYRKEEKHYQQVSIERAEYTFTTSASAVEDLSHAELMTMVQALSPAYRTVFNMYVIDGYTHREIGEILQISEGTSKSNLLKAREVLKERLQKLNVTAYAKSV